MALEPPPFGTLVSGAQLDAMVAAARTPAPPAPAPEPPKVAAPEPLAPPPPEPPKPVVPEPPKPEAIPIPETPKPVPPKVEEKKPEPPPQPVKKPDKTPPPDKQNKKDKQDAKKDAQDKTAKTDAKKPEDLFRAPTKAEELALAERMKAMESKVDKAGVPVGIPWGVEGAKGEASSDACKAALQQYGAQVIKKVRAAVTYPDQVRGLTADLRLQLARDGALINQWVDSSSGNRLFDASLLDAIKKAAPFPTLPACWREDTFMGLIHFVPEEGGAG